MRLLFNTGKAFGRYAGTVALARQRQTGRPSLTVTSTPCPLNHGPDLPRNHNKQLRPKPMRKEDVAAVIKLTGFTPFLEVKFV